MADIPKIAVYPGTFDPITNGHLDILHRATEIFDKVIIAVAPNPKKRPLFSVDERVELIEQSVQANTKIEITRLKGLLVDFARSVQAKAIVRGLRAVSDFEFEFQMTQMNRELAPEIEIIFFMPNQNYFFTSSTLVKQVAEFDPARIAKFVPEAVSETLRKRYGHD